MKCRVYLRVAKTKKRSNSPGYKVAATLKVKASHEPLNTDARFLPTAAFAVDLDIPDVMFERASEVLAELVIDPEDAAIAVQIPTKGKED
jgi:hypothetical protein